MRSGAAVRRAGLTAVNATRVGVPSLRAALLGTDRDFTLAVRERFIGVTGGSSRSAAGGGDSNRTR